MGEDGQPLDMQPGRDEPAEAAQRHTQPGTLYCYVGGLTNLAIAPGSTCLFNRVLPNGVESMAATLAERRGLTLDHARSGCVTSASSGIENSRVRPRSSPRRVRS